MGVVAGFGWISAEVRERFVVATTLQVVLELRVHRRRERIRETIDALGHLLECAQMPGRIPLNPCAICDETQALAQRLC